jgi:hypothetical protein
MLDIAQFTPALKQRYPNWAIQMLTYKNRPAFAMVPKFTDFSGDVIKFPLRFGNPQNVSSTFALANAMTDYSKLEAFLLTRKKKYSNGKISNEVMEAAKSANSPGSFLSSLEVEIDGTLDALANSLAQDLFKSGTGTLAQIKAGTVPALTIELANYSDSVFFEVGMQLAAAATDGGAIAAGQYATITKVDRSAGILTVDTDVSGLGTPWLASWYIYRYGDTNLTMSGIPAWLPYGAGRAAALAATFYNVTRNVDDVRLGGFYKDESANPIEEGLIDGLNAGSHIGGGMYDVVFANQLDFSTLEKAMGAKVQRVQISTEITEGEEVRGKIGFNAIEVYYQNGSVKVVGDRYVPKSYMFPMQLDVWKLCSLGEAIRLFEGDGLKMIRSYNSDALEFRSFSYSNLYCQAPGFNSVLKIA